MGRERERERGRRREESERENTQFHPAVLQHPNSASRSGGRTSGASVRWCGGSRASIGSHIRGAPLPQRGFIRIKAPRTRAHGALGTIQKLEKLLSVLHLRAICGEKRSRSAAFTHGDPELDRRAHASGRRMLIGEWNAPLGRAPRAAEVNIAAMWMLC